MSIEDREPAGAFATDAERLLADCAGAADDARARLVAATAELFVPPEYRLSDMRRAAMRGLAQRMTGTIEDLLRRHLATAFAANARLAAELAGDGPPLAFSALESGGVLRDPEFVAILLRRAEGQALAARRGSRPDDQPPLIDTLRDSEPAIAQAALAYAIAEIRRVDRFDDPLLARTDLPAELHHRLAWWVAAALRRHLVAQRGVPADAADQAVMAAAYATLSGYDESTTLEARAAALAWALHGGGRLDDALLAAATEQGHAPLAVAGFAVRAGIDPAAAWDMATDPAGSRLAVLLRATEVARAEAARILLAFAADAAHLPDMLAGYEALAPDRARAVVRRWRLDAGYRRALDELGMGGGANGPPGMAP